MLILLKLELSGTHTLYTYIVEPFTTETNERGKLYLYERANTNDYALVC